MLYVFNCEENLFINFFYYYFSISITRLQVLLNKNVNTVYKVFTNIAL